MSKHTFGHGLLLGAVLGTAYVFLTSKKTGPQRQHEVNNYVNDLTSETKSAAKNVKEFQKALKNLKNEIELTLKPTVSSIQHDLTEFQIDTEPRLNRIKSMTDKFQE
ncbi:YtxH domain-containing protein [Lapidilactobacillus mulanensis]|uniref:YtxH domain-containing protein n=1 Tax=Lapidilactobacillus mulanensis TaxID=2485999 RepID=A0ABW4DTQ7_9LACO|nr:YtxH domain-containing protein [Lapidilactobacillus mulanensis]